MEALFLLKDIAFENVTKISSKEKCMKLIPMNAWFSHIDIDYANTEEKLSESIAMKIMKLAYYHCHNHSGVKLNSIINHIRLDSKI